MKFKINNREWKITETSQESIKNMQNIRKQRISICRKIFTGRYLLYTEYN